MDLVLAENSLNPVNWLLDEAFELEKEYNITPMSTYELARSVGQGLGCPTCRFSMWFLQTFVNTYALKWSINEGLIAYCKSIVEGLGYSKKICRGMETMQNFDVSYPILFDQLFQEQSMCTFVL